jgi:UDP-glucose 4-epimerase
MDGVWNVGTGRATTVNEVAQTMIAAFGGSGAIEHLPPRGEIRRSCLNVSKLVATGRWRPRVGLATGVAALAKLSMTAPAI